MTAILSRDEGRKLLSKPTKRNKYNATKVMVDGILFDSKREGERYVYLKRLEQAGEISHLERQGKIYLFSGNTPVRYDSGRKAFWKFDFAYFCSVRNKRVIEDVKGVRTDVFKLKKAILLACYEGIEIVEI